MLLADTSAWVWSRRSTDEARRVFDEALAGELIATCDVVKLELLALARDSAEHEARRRELDILQSCPIGPAEWSRAFEVQNRLARVEGEERKVRPQALLVAAAAESAGVELVHHDADFPHIARVTGQPTLWLVRRGSLEP